MKKFLSKNIRLIVIILIFGIFLLPNNIYAENDLEVDGFNIMPELDEEEIANVNEQINRVGSKGGAVWNNYNKAASEMKTSEQLASGIMNRDTIMNYLIFFVQFLSQIGLVVGTVFIMYAGYKYMLSVFYGGKTPTSSIRNAIIGVLIVIFSYAIMRILTSMVGLT